MSGGEAAAATRLVFITRQGCHLCTEALQTVRAVMGAVAPTEAWDIVDVDSNEELQDEHGWDVPVVIVDGERFAKWRVDGDALRERLQHGVRHGPRHAKSPTP